MAENICTVMETMEKDSTAAAVTALVRYGVSRGLITGDDAVFAANSIFDLMQMDPSGEYMPLEEGAPEDFTAVPDTADGEDSRHFDDGSELASILKVLLGQAQLQKQLEAICRLDSLPQDQDGVRLVVQAQLQLSLWVRQLQKVLEYHLVHSADILNLNLIMRLRTMQAIHMEWIL